MTKEMRNKKKAVKLTSETLHKVLHYYFFSKEWKSCHLENNYTSFIM